MSCVVADRRFRLLDYLVGWDVDSVQGLEGAEDAAGLRLARLAGDLPGGLVDSHITPPRLARGCDPCTWYLVTAAPPASRLLMLGACDDCWRPLGALPLVDAVAVAVDRFRIAVVDRGSGRVWIVSTAEGRILGEAMIANGVAAAFSPEATLVVAATNPPRLAEFDLGGRPLGGRFPALPAGEIDRLAYGGDCALWLVMRDAADGLSLWRLPRGAGAFVAASADELATAFPPLPIVRTGPRGFCLDRGCWNWQGRATTADRIGAHPTSGAYAAQGQYLSRAIDSGVVRCRWHRLRVDADVPPGTTFEIALATSDAPAPAAQGANGPDWMGFPAGIPHPDDWQIVTAPAADVLIAQPAGRYLFVRLRLTGDGSATPHVRRLRLDLPRATSADLLPIVYREEPDAADFTERFLALFDSVLGDMDEAVARFPALIDAGGVPDELLGWVGAILGTALDGAWPADRRRALLQAAPGIFRRRGTPGALVDVVRILAGVEPVVDEPGLARAWGAIGAAGAIGIRLGRTRLFSRGAARFKLGASTLGGSALRSFGNPDLDPHRSGAFRITLGLPPVDEATRLRILRLAEDLVPGHILIDVRAGREDGFWLMPGAVLAVDTRFAAPPPPVLGTGVRLGRTSILPTTSCRDGFALGLSSACGHC